ncbi:MAG: PorT family protein [Bacteroidia bacterium]|nr:PorT family protein [Bacteroidia bacterium]
MKKKITILFVLWVCFSLQPFNAQESKITIGINGGPNRNQMVGNDFANRIYGAAFRFAAGATVEYKLTKRISAFSGINYEKKGMSVKNIIVTDIAGTNVGKGEMNIFLNYLVVPLTGKLYIGKKVKGFLSAGAYGAYLLNARSASGGTNMAPYSQDLTTIYKRADMGLLGGIGMTVPFGKFNALLEARYNHGLYNYGTSKLFNGQPINNTSINLMCGISYCLGK